MQQIEAAGGEEARDRDPAALDEQPPHAARAQRFEHGAWMQRTVRVGQAHDLGLGQPLAILTIGATQHEGGRWDLAEHPMARLQPAVGVEHHAQRAGPRYQPHGELRVVVGHGAGSHEHRIAQRPQPMHVDEVGLAGDAIRMAGLGGDPAVQALAEMGHDQKPVGRGRQELAIGGEQPPLLGRQPVEREFGRIGAAVRAGQQPFPGAGETPLARIRPGAQEHGRPAAHSRIASSSMRIGISSATQPFSTA